MDVIKPRKRQLFRTQALRFFVGVFGDNSAPTLLFPWPKYIGTLVITCSISIVLVWLVFAERAIRVDVSGHMASVDANLYCFKVTEPSPAFKKIKSGQTGALFFKKEFVQFRVSSFACSRPAIPLHIVQDVPFLDEKVQLRLTVGHEAFWSFLMGELS